MGLNIVVIGGGLAGLATASFLRKHHNVTVLERHKLDFTRNDYGISLMCNAFALLLKAGFNEASLDGVCINKVWARTHDNKEEFTRDLDTMRMFGAPSVIAWRSQMLEELHRMATSTEFEGHPARMVEGCKVVRVDPETGTAYTADGNAYHGELVIDADGINSVARDAVLAVSDDAASAEAAVICHDLLAFFPTSNAGLVTWRTPNGDAFGRNKRCILAYHISKSDFGITGYAPEREFTSQFDEQKTTIIKGIPAQRMQREYADFLPVITELFQHHHSNDGSVEAWRIRDVRPLAQWHRGRVVLIGDAAHAVTPHAGQGANIAIEDAEALGDLLTSAQSGPDVEAALHDFIRIRKARAEDVARGSRRMAGVMTAEEEAKHGEFDRQAFMNRTYSYWGAEAALRHSG